MNGEDLGAERLEMGVDGPGTAHCRQTGAAC